MAEERDEYCQAGLISHYTTDSGYPVIVFSAYEDHEGIIWIGTLGGDWCARSKRWENCELQIHPSIWNLCRTTKCGAFFEDNAPLCGLPLDGISYFNRSIAKFVTHKVSQGQGGENNNSVFALTEDRDGNIWVEYLVADWMFYSRAERKFVNERFPSSTIRSCDSTNIFAFAGRPKANTVDWNFRRTYQAMTEKRAVSQYKHSASDKNSLSNNYVRCIREDKKRNVVDRGTHGGGLNVFDRIGKSSKFTVTFLQIQVHWARMWCWQLRGQRRSIVVGTYGGGLKKWTRQRKIHCLPHGSERCHDDQQ